MTTILENRARKLETIVDVIFADIDNLRQNLRNDMASPKDNLEELYCSLDDLISEARIMQMFIAERW